MSGNVAFGGGATVTSIEEVLVGNFNAGAITFSGVGFTGVNTWWANGGIAMLTINPINELTNLGVRNTDQDFTATFKNALFGSGTVEIFLDGAADGVDIIVGSTTAGASGNGFDTFILNSMGSAANRIDGVDDAGSNKFVTLKMVGSQNLRVDGAIAWETSPVAGGVGAWVGYRL